MTASVVVSDAVVVASIVDIVVSEAVVVASVVDVVVSKVVEVASVVDNDDSSFIYTSYKDRTAPDTRSGEENFNAVLSNHI